ncbi:uncharacterized protein V6R79_021183 [Siganus canaliculatus]
MATLLPSRRRGFPHNLWMFGGGESTFSVARCLSSAALTSSCKTSTCFQRSAVVLELCSLSVLDAVAIKSTTTRRDETRGDDERKESEQQSKDDDGTTSPGGETAGRF